MNISIGAPRFAIPHIPRVLSIGQKSFLVLFILSVTLLGCSKRDPFLIEYVRQFHPNMTRQEIEALFPTTIKSIETSVEDGKTGVGIMTRRFSNNEVVKGIFYDSKYASNPSIINVYYDKYNVIVGFEYSSSSGPQLRDNELRFPIASAAPVGASVQRPQEPKNQEEK